MSTQPSLCSKLASFAWAALSSVSVAHAGVEFVSVQLTSGNNDGTSWADARQGIDGLQTALSAATAGDQIWVARGVYKPTATANRSISFDLKNGVAIFGGFLGNEVSLDERDPALNETILSGDLGDDDANALFGENSIHVVRGNSAGPTALFDGFTISGGNANGSASGSNDRGGGFLMQSMSNAAIARCVVKDNRCTFGGGAGYITQSSPTFTDTRFENNSGGSFGGAFDMATSVGATFNRCTFSGNKAARAGGIEIFGNSPVKVYNCLFRGNTATGSGGGGALFISGSAAVIRNCTIVDNVATSNVAGILHASGGTSIGNSIIAFNTGPMGSQSASEQITAAVALTVGYSCVQGGFTGTGNTSADPLFVDFAQGDYHVASGSPCIDAGSNLLVPASSTLDLALDPRVADDPTTADSGPGSAPIVDLGVFEVQNDLYTTFCFGDGSQTTACPCFNFGSPGHGCADSSFLGTGPGALLVASGGPSPDTVVLTASDLLPNTLCIFLQGNAQIANGAVFGDGLRCIDGQLIRLGLEPTGSGVASYPGPGEMTITDRAAVNGDLISSGDVRSYQAWYRDLDPGFCSAPQGDLWNITSGVVVQW